MRPNGDICDDVIKHGMIRKALRMYHVPTVYADDMQQEVCLLLLEMCTDRLNDIASSGKLEPFIARTVRNMWRSRTSRFYYKYRKNAQAQATDFARVADK